MKLNRAWWGRLVIPTLRRLRQEGCHEFKACLIKQNTNYKLILRGHKEIVVVNAFSLNVL